MQMDSQQRTKAAVRTSIKKECFAAAGIFTTPPTPFAADTPTYLVRRHTKFQNYGQEKALNVSLNGDIFAEIVKRKLYTRRYQYAHKKGPIINTGPSRHLSFTLL